MLSVICKKIIATCREDGINWGMAVNIDEGTPEEDSSEEREIEESLFPMMSAEQKAAILASQRDAFDIMILDPTNLRIAASGGQPMGRADIHANFRSGFNRTMEAVSRTIANNDRKAAEAKRIANDAVRIANRRILNIGMLVVCLMILLFFFASWLYVPHDTSSAGVTPRETHDEELSVSKSKSAAITRFRQGEYSEAKGSSGVTRSETPEEKRNDSEAESAAITLYRQGKYPEAENAFRKLIAIRERTKGAQHPATLSSRNNLACVLAEQGKHYEAANEDRALLSIRERVLGAEHPDTLDSRQNLATALQEQREYAEAEKEFRILLSIRERVLGTEHPDVIHCCYSLLACLVAQRKLEESLEFAKRTEDGFKKMRNPDAKQAQQIRESIETALAK